MKWENETGTTRRFCRGKRRRDPRGPARLAALNDKRDNLILYRCVPKTQTRT
jgi:hypothetical protein